jgi:hypothetical protein
MQGQKDIQPKMMYQVHLDSLVPTDNFYRRLSAENDLNFLYKATEPYYGREGQERSKTVEPVPGTLINFTNMRRINSRGIKQANKHVLMAALTYNLKKYMKWNSRKFIVKVMELNVPLNKLLNDLKMALKSIISQPGTLRKRWQTNLELFPERAI